MNRHLRHLLCLGLVLLILGPVSACAPRGYQVRHLAANVSLLEPGMESRQVLAIMGLPDFRRSAQSGAEEWLYLQALESRLRRSTLLGRWLGHEDYHLAVLTIADDRLVDSIYRYPTAEEFRKLGGTTSREAR